MLPFPTVPRSGDERTMLLSMLDDQRASMLWKLDGLSEGEVVRPMVPSGTSLLGLVKHLAYVEQWWFAEFVGGGSPDYPWTDEDPDADFRIEDGETIASVSELYVDSIRQANDVMADVDDLDAMRAAGDREASVRWVLLHMIEETARHAGHADIVREQIDGATGRTPARP